MADPMPSAEEFGALFARFLRDVVDRAPEPESELARRLRTHLGSDPFAAPLITARLAPFEHPDLQRAIDAYVDAANRSHETLGLGGHPGMDLRDQLYHTRGPVRAPTYAERPSDVGRRLACLSDALILVTDSAAPPHAIVVTSENEMMFESLSVGVLAADSGQSRAILGELRSLMTERSVYKGKVLTLTNPHGEPSGAGVGATFLPRPQVPREAIVLPEGTLERIERRTVRFDEVADRLTAQGLSRKRGVLLYGPPGTGKTLTVQYLIGRMHERTVVVLTGQGLTAIAGAATLARRLQPAMLVLEDIDLVAHDRSFDPMGNPVLFELLNTLDGLGEDDRDIVVLLTTNRADLLEPALAARPGRVDLAVELPLPEAAERERLLQLCSGGVEHDVDDWTAAVQRTAGTPASFISELVRTAVLLAAERGAQRFTGADIDEAIDELLESGPLTASLLGARWSPDESGEVPGAGPGPGPSMWAAGPMRGFVTFGHATPDMGRLTDEAEG